MLLLSPGRLAAVALLTPLAVSAGPAFGPVGLRLTAERPATAAPPAWAMPSSQHVIYAPALPLTVAATAVASLPPVTPTPQPTFAAWAVDDLARARPTPPGEELPIWLDDEPMLKAVQLPTVPHPESVLKTPSPRSHAVADLEAPSVAGESMAAAVVQGSILETTGPVVSEPPPVSTPILSIEPPAGGVALPEPAVLLPLGALAALTRRRSDRSRRKARPDRSNRGTAGR